MLPTKPDPKATLRRHFSSSQNDYRSPFRWTILHSLLHNGIARVSYVLPIAGYSILYSDYFNSLFKVSILSSSHGFLSFKQRVNMLYYGSCLMLVAFGLYQFSPRLLRTSPFQPDFIQRAVVSRDVPMTKFAMREMREYIKRVEGVPDPDPSVQSTNEISQFYLDTNSLASISAIQWTEGAWSTRTIEALRFYHNHTNLSRPCLRYITFFLAVFGYGLLGIPAIDLFVRVFSTSLFGLLPVRLTPA